MRPRLETMVESLRFVLRPGREDDRVEAPPLPRAGVATPESERWNDPVPLMRDRDGHMHVLL